MADKFGELRIFNEAHTFVLAIYKSTKSFPSFEQFALTSQIRRSASSIVANIVEGNARNHRKEFLQFLYLANGSLEETKYHLLLSKDLNYLDEVEYKVLHEQSEIVGKMLNGLIQYLKSVNRKS
ncbi:MAG TPA: four helix bundle protein [Patescibacteria group bacterium]|nr:four helix bundle protein [Patescibacteria group bacterium]